MPIYAEIEGMGKLEFPDGTDPAVIQQTVDRMVKFGAAQKQNNPISKTLGSVQRGAIDVLGGGAQLLARGANALGIVPESNPDGILAGPKDVEAQNAQARANVDRWHGKEPAFDPVRAGAAGLLTLPLAPTKFLQAPTALGRSGGAAVSGGVVGAAQEVENPASNADFWKRKGLQAGAGFVAGGVSQPIAEAVVSHVVKGLNVAADRAVAGAKNLTGANSAEKIVGLTREALKKSGINYDSLDEAAKAGLLDAVQKALGEYSGVNPDAIARQAAFRQERFDPLRHWVTRDPAEFTTLENLSHQPAGDVLKQRKADLDSHVLKRLTGMRGNQPTPEDVGQAANRDLSAHLRQQEGKTNVLYDTFREIAPNVKGEPQRFANDLFGGLEGEFAGAALPEGLRKIVNKISAGEIPLTPSTLYQLQKMANGARGSDGSTNYALGHLSRAIDRELEAISGTSAPRAEGAHYAADVLKMARGQHAKTRGEVEDSKLLSAVEKGAAVDENFTDRLMGSSVKEIASSWTKLNSETKQGIRAQVIDEIKRIAYGGASDGAGKSASQAMLNKYLSDPTQEQKLRIVLGQKGVEEIKRLALMLEAAHLQPSGSAVNNSKTGGALLSAFSRGADAMKSKGIPGGTALQDTAARSLAQSAQHVPPGALGRQSLVIDPMVEELLKRRTGHFAGLLGASSAYPMLLEDFLGK